MRAVKRGDAAVIIKEVSPPGDARRNSRVAFIGRVICHAKETGLRIVEYRGIGIDKRQCFGGFGIGGAPEKQHQHVTAAHCIKGITRIPAQGRAVK